MAGPKGLDFRASIGQRAIATSIFGDIGDFVRDAVFGEAGRRLAPPTLPGFPPPPAPGPKKKKLPPFIPPVADPFVDPTPFDPFVPVAPEGCLPFQTRDPITGECRFDFDPGPGTGLPGGGDAAGGGLNRPTLIARNVLECPTFADGKKGILWMNALTGDVVCLPRRTSGKGFGLIRKNPPRKKAFITAAEKSLLTKMKSVQTRAKKFATDAGFSCKKR